MKSITSTAKKFSQLKNILSNGLIRNDASIPYIVNKLLTAYDFPRMSSKIQKGID